LVTSLTADRACYLLNLLPYNRRRRLFCNGGETFFMKPCQF
jgi:hypothetical protein